MSTPSSTLHINASMLLLSTEPMALPVSSSFTLNYTNGTLLNPTLNTLWDENRRKASNFIIVILYLAGLMITGFLGNSLVCYVYYFRFSSTPANLFIFALGVLDLASCCIGMPFEICDLSYPYMFDAPVACKLLRFAESVTIIASAATLICVAFDRYFKICRPFHKLPLRVARILCLVSALLGLFLSWPALVIFGRKSIPTSDPNITGVECTVDDNIRNSVYPTLYYGTLSGVFVIAVCVIVTLYTLIGRMVWKIKRTTIGEVLDITRRPSGVSFQMSTSSSRDERRTSTDSEVRAIPTSRSAIRAGRTTAIFITVTVIFVLSFLPFLTVTLLKAAKVAFNTFESTLQEVIYNLCVRSYFINNSINPFIYSVMNVNFRRECLALFTRAFNACINLKAFRKFRR